MPKRRLTEEGVAKLNPPADGQIDYYDAVMPGLVLRVNYGGAKAWRALYYINKTGKNGKRITTPTTYKLGRYPHLKLKEAREEGAPVSGRSAASIDEGRDRQLSGRGREFHQAPRRT